MKLFIIATIIIVVLLGSFLMNAANNHVQKYNSSLTEVMKDLN